MMTFANVATMRRLLLTALMALTALLMVSATAPPDANASAFYVPVASSYQGWARTSDDADVCLKSMPPQCRHAAWSWTGSAWSNTTISDLATVYAYPYAGGWHWAWTERSGWIAIRTSKLERGISNCTGVICAA